MNGSRHPPSPRRVALYSHDTQGLGHVRRNIAVASALAAASPGTDVLLLTGSPEATSLPLPSNTDVVTLPTLHKDVAGSYRARTLRVPLHEIVRLRGRIVAAAVAGFRPDLFVADKVARGLHGELDATLRALRDAGARVVLGLRDVLDAPAVTRREWRDERTAETVRDHYDEVWVYGDPAVYDAAARYRWPWAVRRKVVYTGYLADGRPARGPAGPCPAGEGPPAQPFVLCLVGGGQDGAALAAAFARCVLPPGHTGVLLGGPYLDPERHAQLVRAARDRPGLTVHGFTPRADEFVAAAAATVTMGGYNSVCELLAARRPALVVPRVTPRLEQALRAEALARHGWVDTLWPGGLTPERLGTWLADAVRSPQRRRRPIDLDGLTRIPVLAARLLDPGPREAGDHAAG